MPESGVGTARRRRCPWRLGDDLPAFDTEHVRAQLAERVRKEHFHGVSGICCGSLPGPVTLWRSTVGRGSEAHDRALGSDLLEENIAAAQFRHGLGRSCSLSRTAFEQREIVNEGAPAGPWSVVVCRNVAIYVHGAAEERRFGSLVAVVSPGCILRLGGSERPANPPALGLEHAGSSAWGRPSVSAERTPLILADGPRLEQEIDNLVPKAIKYAPRVGTVTVSLETAGRAVVVALTDTGIDISRGDQENHFDRFFRAKDARSMCIAGVGLGVSVVQAIVEGHGGRRALESTEGQGSGFRMKLPVTGPRSPAPGGGA